MSKTKHLQRLVRRKGDPELVWKIHTPGMLKEIVNGSGMDIYRIPLNILRELLVAVGERAAQLNDPIMNALMVKLTIYAVADPYEKDYDPKAVTRILIMGDKARRREQMKAKAA